MTFKVGLMVNVVYNKDHFSNRKWFRHFEIKGWKDYPGEYGYHESVVVRNGSPGVVLEIRTDNQDSEFLRVFVNEVGPLWFESYRLIPVQIE